MKNLRHHLIKSIFPQLAPMREALKFELIKCNIMQTIKNDKNEQSIS